jgi:hypothetical protein
MFALNMGIYTLELSSQSGISSYSTNSNTGLKIPSGFSEKPTEFLFQRIICQILSIENHNDCTYSFNSGSSSSSGYLPVIENILFKV